MIDKKIEKRYLVVIGMNRPRLNKILSLVEERESDDASSNHEIAMMTVTVVPCLAAMGSYKDENGNFVRYLSNVVYHDGSPLTTYFDDASFRENLDSVLLVGYEWLKGDDEKIQGYFHANQLEVSVTCGDPNQEFDNLHEEMEAFKVLDDETKQKCQSNGSMGPGKMAKMIIEAVSRIKKTKAEAIEQEKEEAEKNAQLEAEMAAMAIQEQQDRREPPDPSRPRYACRICRTILFGENHLEKGHVQNLHSFRKLSHAQSTPVSSCQSIFCSDDVLQWLSPSGQEIEGKLTCPRCSHKIGHWRWAGAQCSCGTWVTPAIQIPSSKVDIVTPAFNNHPVELVGIINPSILSPSS